MLGEEMSDKTTAHISEHLYMFGSFMKVDGDLAVQQFLLLKRWNVRLWHFLLIHSILSNLYK